MILKNCIVRIYRSEKNNPRNLVGVVEEVGADERKAFTNLDELWKILSFKNYKEDDEKSRRLG